MSDSKQNKPPIDLNRLVEFVRSQRGKKPPANNELRKKAIKAYRRVSGQNDLHSKKPA